MPPAAGGGGGEKVVAPSKGADSPFEPGQAGRHGSNLGSALAKSLCPEQRARPNSRRPQAGSAPLVRRDTLLDKVPLSLNRTGEQYLDLASSGDTYAVWDQCQSVGGCQGCKLMRALFARRTDDDATVRAHGGDDTQQVQLPVRAPLEVIGRDGRDLAGERRAVTRELPEGRQSHDLIADHRGDGVTRQTEDRDPAPPCRGDGCERQRLRGLDRNLELMGLPPDLGHQCFQGHLHEVELAHADPTGSEQCIAAFGSLANPCRDRLFVVAANTEVNAYETVPLQRREQALPVGVSDLAQLERHRAAHELVSGRKDADIRPCVDCYPCRVEAREQADMGRADNRAGSARQITAIQIATGWADVGARGDLFEGSDRAI